VEAGEATKRHFSSHCKITFILILTI